MALQPQYAGMVPMSIGSRREDAIFYFSEEWEDLANLFEAPLEFLRAQQFLWTQKAKDSISWQLIGPITATIECGLKNPLAFVNTLRWFGPQIGAGMGGHPYTYQVDFTVAQLSQIISYLSKGMFFVEFNTYTNSISVVYFPPSRPRKNRFKGSISEASLITAKVPVSVFGSPPTQSAILHYDLDQTSHRMRADFLVGVMEHPETLTDLLGKQTVGQFEFNMEGAETPKKGLSAAQPLPKPPQDLTFQLGVDEPWDTKGSSDLFDALKPYNKYQSMVVENLSDPMELAVCNTQPAYVKRNPLKAGRVVQVATILCHAYMRSVYDPASVVQKYTKTGGKSKQ